MKVLYEWKEIFKKQREIYYGKEILEERQLEDNCINCGESNLDKNLIDNYNVCNKCGYHFRLDSNKRIKSIFDESTVNYINEELECSDILNFPKYEEKLKEAKKNTGLKSAVITGKGSISGHEVYFGVCDYRFMMGSMGSTEGEKLTRMIETATKEGLAIVIFSASGGARIQEGMLSLHQMIKVSAKLKEHSDKGLLYISVVTDPTTGGVNASFASLGDIIISEPNATIGFAGKRVIQQTLGKKIPEGFQKSEWVLKNGFLDCIVERKDMKEYLAKILNMHCKNTRNIDENYIEKDTTNIKRNEDDGRSSWDTLMIARNRKRPNYKDFIMAITNDFIELHGDRCCGEDNAIIGGIALLNKIPVTVIASAKGSSPQENVNRNMGMAHPEGYRKVIRLMKQAEKFNRPIICFIDTPGAYCGVEAELRGQGQAIANCLFEVSSLKTPIITIIHGEGGSGGALAIGVGDYIYMYKNSIYSVISPESAAAIVYKNVSKAEKIAPHLKFKSSDLIKLNLIDEIIDEAFEGLHVTGLTKIEELKMNLYEKITALSKLNKNELVKRRGDRIRNCLNVEKIKLDGLE